jgi:hypothetical protein
MVTLYRAALEICRTAVKNPWYQNDQLWGKIDEVSYVNTVSDLFKQWKEGKLNKNTEGRKTVEKAYSQRVFRERVQARLKEISDRLDN